MRIVFQGDSITDAGRSRWRARSLGNGYVSLVASEIARRHPGRRITVSNRGVAGNRIGDLRGRWQRDCLDLRPDWVSILIGINDTWRRYDSGAVTAAEDFERTYSALLEQTLAQGARIVLCAPFLLPLQPGQERWHEDLDPKIAVVRHLAERYATRYIPLDEIFAQAATRQPVTQWVEDGVHPTAAGHALIARAWLDTMQDVLVDGN